MSYARAPPSPSTSDVSSDLDLDLEELDPATTSSRFAAGARHSILGSNHRASFSPLRRESRESEGGTGRIALRNLAGMGLGRSRGGFGGGDDDDQEALLGNQDGRRSTSVGRADESGDNRRHLLRRLSSRLSLRGSVRGAERDGSPAPSVHPDFTPSTETRTVELNGASTPSKTKAHPPNIISNHRFTALTFLPLTLYHEFSFFFNLYFLLVALSQVIPALRIGFLSTYIVPLVFVLAITLGKEAHDDIARRRRDAEANSEPYEVLAIAGTGVQHAGRSRTLGKKKAPFQEGHQVRTGDGETLKTVVKKSRDLKVGDVLVLKKDHRVPADVIILKTISNETESVEEGQGDDSSSTSGEAFIRTDQLDGETDWKLRMAPALSQALPTAKLEGLRIAASAPSREVNNFIGTLTYPGSGLSSEDSESPSHYQKSSSFGLSIDNTAWANTVLASNSTTLAAIIYTGPETRAALSTSRGRSKTGLLEKEINNLTKILCLLTLTLSVVLVALHGFDNEPIRSSVENREGPGQVVSGAWYIRILRFLILFSTIIPISLRVNLDMGKSAYAWFIERDKDIAGTVVRTSTIPEELGRVEYLLSDKTGTLTQNDMELRKIHVGTVSYAGEAMDEVVDYVKQGFSVSTRMSAEALVTPTTSAAVTQPAITRTRREIGSRVRDVVLALALCHNVTPTTATEEGHAEAVTTYQASSPDEIAIVSWTESVGLRLVHRDRKGMKLQSVDSGEVVVKVKILEVFPFSSEGKRMGIIVQFIAGNNPKKEHDLLAGHHHEDDTISGKDSNDIWFYQKGADTVMSSIVASNDWLDEECGNMAREGLRTLVIGRKRLGSERYQEFSSKYKAMSLLLQNRDREMEKVVKDYLEHDLELLGVTGVEDKLQKDVKPSLELLRNAGIKIWMLTGDKVETARCVAVSAKLVARGQYIHTIARSMFNGLRVHEFAISMLTFTVVKRKDLAYDALEFLRNKTDSCLLIDGESLSLFLEHYKDLFISLAVQLPAVVACRCTPTQKADIARLIREFTKKRICCIGDGGNDVSMIQAADVGVGIVGKEGRQASLAADFSVEQFCHLTKLLVWHGRNSYKRSAKLAQFVMHRGLVISVCQTMFSIASKFEPIALYQVR
jgi:phospholipid-translocating ATPase